MMMVCASRFRFRLILTGLLKRYFVQFPCAAAAVSLGCKLGLEMWGVSVGQFIAPWHNSRELMTTIAGFTRRQRMVYCGRTVSPRNERLTCLEISDQGLSNGI